MSLSEKKPTSLARNAGAMSVAVMISRVLGLVREQAFAYFFGAGIASDAYLVAFRIPNLFRDLFAEGALSSAFITVFSRTLEPDRAKELARNVMAVITLAVGCVCALLFIFAPQIVNAMAGDFASRPGKLELTITLTRMLIPFLYFASSAALAMGILNSLGVFFIPSMGAAAFNLGNVLIGGGLAYLMRAQGPTGSILGFGIGTLIGGFFQWSVQWPELKRHGYTPLAGFLGAFSLKRLRTALRDPKLREILRLMAPAVMAVSAVQINVMVDTYFATSLAEGSVSWLSYSFRIMHFPMGVFGVALSAATLPRLSRLVRENNVGGFQATLEEALKWTLILGVGSAAGLIVFREPLVSLIYQHGKLFTPYHTVMTANALATFAIGLLAFNGTKIFIPAFYALDSVWVPSAISLFSIAMNFGLDMILSKPLGHAGLALSTSITSYFNMCMLMILLWRSGHFRFSAALGKVFLATMLGAGFMALVYYAGLPQMLIQFRADKGFTLFAASTLASVALCGLTYLFMIAAFTAEGRQLLKKLSARFAGSGVTKA